MKATQENAKRLKQGARAFSPSRLRWSKWCFFGALLWPLAAQEPLTYEAFGYLLSSGDFDDATPDGRTDLVVVDRSRDTVIFGIQQTDGSFEWTPPTPTGFENVDSLAVGAFNGVPARQSAISSDYGNRISIFTADSAGGNPAIRHVYASLPGPEAIGAFFVDGDGTQDLVVAGDRGDRFYVERLVALSSNPASQGALLTTQRTRRVWPFRHKRVNGVKPLAAMIRGSQFLVADVTGSGLGNERVLAGVNATFSTKMTYGYYDGSDLARVLVYNAGSTTAKSAQMVDGTFQWGALSTLTFPKPVELILTVPTNAGSRLAVLYRDKTAAIYDYDGAALTLKANLPGLHDFLAPVGTHGLLSQRNGEWQRFNAESGGVVRSGDFPSSGGMSNILFVSAEPFVDPESTPVFAGKVRDWTVLATGSGMSWTVTSLTQGSNGLGSVASAGFQPSPGASHALVNQYLPNVSISLLDDSVGPAVGEVFISPPSGNFPPLKDLKVPPGPDVVSPVFVTLSSTLPNAVIRYRFGASGPWLVYNENSPPKVESRTVVMAYAEGNGQRTPRKRVVYDFEEAEPLFLGNGSDSNNNGLSDEWEQTFNITDPNGDADGDGESNLTEFQNGTDPLNASSGGVVISDKLLKAEAIEDGILITWPLSASHLQLQHSETLETWNDVTTGITQTAIRFEYRVPLGGGGFYRLVR